MIGNTVHWARTGKLVGVKVEAGEVRDDAAHANARRWMRDDVADHIAVLEVARAADNGDVGHCFRQQAAIPLSAAAAQRLEK